MVSFTSAEAAKAAIELSGVEIAGRSVAIELAKPLKMNDRGVGRGGRGGGRGGRGGSRGHI